MSAETFYESVADLAANLPANRLFLPAVVQAALKTCLEEAFSAAGGIYLDIPIHLGGEYADSPENFVSLAARVATNPAISDGLFSRRVDVDATFFSNRSLPYETACRLFHGIMLALQPANLLADFRAAVAAVDSNFVVASIKDGGETQDVSDEGRTMTKTLNVSIGKSV